MLEFQPRLFPGPSPVLLIHGFASSGQADWIDAGWPEALAAAGRGALVVGLPGHPDGPVAGRGELPTSAVVAALARVLAAAGGEDVIGYSLGARLAWDLAGSGVRRLVLGGLAAGDPFAGIDGDEVAAAVAGGAPANPVVGFVAEAARAPGCDAATIVAFVEGLGAEPFLPWTRPPQCPALFVSGWDDEVAKGVESVAALAPDGRVQRIDGDHEGALHSAAFQAAAISFLTA